MFSRLDVRRTKNQVLRFMFFSPVLAFMFAFLGHRPLQSWLFSSSSCGVSAPRASFFSQEDATGCVKNTVLSPQSSMKNSSFCDICHFVRHSQTKNVLPKISIFCRFSLAPGEGFIPRIWRSCWAFHVKKERNIALLEGVSSVMNVPSPAPIQILGKSTFTKWTKRWSSVWISAKTIVGL